MLKVPDLKSYFTVLPDDNLVMAKPLPQVIFPEAEKAIKASQVPLPEVKVKIIR